MFTIKNMKKLGVIFLSICVLVCAFGCWIGVFSPSTSTEIADAAIGGYYDDLNETLTGKAFRTELADLITDTHKTITSYGDMKQHYWATDADPNKSGNILLFYTGMSYAWDGSFGSSNSSISREHVWCQSLGNFTTSNAGADAHHIQPINQGLNGQRSNQSFGEVPQTSANIAPQFGTTNYDNLCYDNGTFFYPGEGYRGATARILMYVQTRWGGNYTLKFVLGEAKSGSNSIGDIETLMKWHLEEPPTAREIARNEAVAKIQGNRNPFIDHPEYAEMIYCHDGESYNDELQACVDKYGSYLSGGQGGSSDVEVTSLSITPSSTTIAANSTTRLTVTAYPTGASSAVTWSSSNSNIASVDNGIVTGISAGTATITATSTKNPSIKATATVSVKAISAITISGTPTKTKYMAGEKFNPAGLTVTATYTDNSTITIPTSDCQWLDGTTKLATLSQGTTTVLMRYGNIEKTITGITVEKSTTQTLTITRDSFSGSGGYAWTTWSAGGISGKAFMYPGNANNIQMNSSKTAQYIFNTTALPGDIVSITIKTTADKTWQVLTSSTPFSEGSGKATGGTVAGTVNSSTTGGSLSISGGGKYFALNYTSTGAVYIDEIVIVYNAESSSGSPHTHTPGDWIVDSNSTCKIQGSRHTECTGCGEVVDVEALPLENHKFGDWSATDDNKESRTCSVCGHTETRNAENQGGGTDTPGGGTDTPGGGTDTPGGGNQGGNEDGDEVDQELIASFNTAVGAAQSATTMSEKFSAIKTALSLYNQMTDAEQNLVLDAYADLEDAIASYNNATAVVNNESNKATENAIMLFAGAFSVLAFAAYFLLRR